MRLLYDLRPELLNPFVALMAQMKTESLGDANASLAVNTAFCRRWGKGGGGNRREGLRDPHLSLSRRALEALPPLHGHNVSRGSALAHAELLCTPWVNRYFDGV